MHMAIDNNRDQANRNLGRKRVYTSLDLIWNDTVSSRYYLFKYIYIYRYINYIVRVKQITSHVTQALDIEILLFEIN